RMNTPRRLVAFIIYGLWWLALSRCGTVSALWHGLLTVPLRPTEGLLSRAELETFGQPPWHGRETVPQREVQALEQQERNHCARPAPMPEPVVDEHDRRRRVAVERPAVAAERQRKHDDIEPPHERRIVGSVLEAHIGRRQRASHGDILRAAVDDGERRAR